MEQKPIWDEKTNTFYLVTQVDETTVTSEPITKEEYYKWLSENKL